MVRKVDKNARLTPSKRKQKKLIIIGTEGNNKTERLYLTEWNRILKEYSFIFAEGNRTDPNGILDELIKKKNKEDVDYDYGDRVICLYDIDENSSKKDSFNEIKKKAENNRIELYTSNPCFEVWYIEHFCFTSKLLRNSEKVITELKKQIPNYKKNYCNFEILRPLTKDAIKNCERLEKHHKEYGSANPIELNNPITSIHVLLKTIIPDLNSIG